MSIGAFKHYLTDLFWNHKIEVISDLVKAAALHPLVCFFSFFLPALVVFELKPQKHNVTTILDDVYNGSDKYRSILLSKNGFAIFSR